MLRGNSIEPDESCKMLVPNGGLNGFPLTRRRIALILPGISQQYRRACSENIRPRTFLKFKAETKLPSKLRIFKLMKLFFFLCFIPNNKIRIKRNIHHITFILFQRSYPLATRTRYSYQQAFPNFRPNISQLGVTITTGQRGNELNNDNDVDTRADKASIREREREKLRYSLETIWQASCFVRRRPLFTESGLAIATFN